MARDPSFAQPAHLLGTPASGAIPVAAAPAGGQGVALAPDGSLPAGVLGQLFMPAIYLDTDTNTPGTSYSVLTRGPIIPWRPGMTLQIRVVAWFHAGASSTAFAACRVTTGNLGGNITDDTTANGEVSTSSTGDTLQDSGWVSIDSSIVDAADYIGLNLASKRTGSNNGVLKTGTAVFFQWV